MSWSRIAERSMLRPGESPELGRSRILVVVPTDCSFEHMAVNQRLRALAEIADVDIVASYATSFPHEIRGLCRPRGFILSTRVASSVLRSLIFSVEVTIWALLRRPRRRYQIVYTFQDMSAFAGRLLRSHVTRWVIDILDDPSLEQRNAEQQRRRFKAAILRLRSRLIAGMAHSADLVVTIGCSDEDPLPMMIHQRYGVPAERLITLRQAVRTEHFATAMQPQKTTSGTRSIFYVGWVSALRGIDTLVEAIDILRGEGEDVELRVAGRLKESEVRLRDMIEARSYVHYLGLLPSPSVQQEALRADVCCCPFPDRQELAPVQPVKVLEYLALGRPVVASRTHGISSLIIHELNGLLATPGSAVSFAEEIHRIIRDDQMARRLSEGARAGISAFDANDVNSNLQQRLRKWL